MTPIIRHGIEYKNVFKHDQKNILKYSSLPPEIWNILQSKKLFFLNIPTKIFTLTEEEQEKYFNCQSKIILPYIEGETLIEETITKDLSTEQFLKLFKYNLSLLEIMHKNNVIHGDIYPGNIMITPNGNIHFIDLDYDIVDDFIPQENVYIEESNDVELIKLQTMKDDKIDLLSSYLYRMLYGQFNQEIIRYLNIKKLKFPKIIEDEINAILLEYYIPSKDDYFIQLLDELLKIGYEIPTISQAKKLSKIRF